jgi:Peptidogalycan biosysnthesis/recognition
VTGGRAFSPPCSFFNWAIDVERGCKPDVDEPVPPRPQFQRKATNPATVWGANMNAARTSSSNLAYPASHAIAEPGTRDAAEEAERAGEESASVVVMARSQLADCPHWQQAFSSQHKDRRYYEIVAETLHREFEYLFFAIRGERREIRAIQPFFVLNQDILAGLRPYLGRLIDAIRAQWPRFMYLTTIMIGCVAGEAHLDCADESTCAADAQLLAGAVVQHARKLGARLIVLKEFPKQYRDALSCFIDAGFTRVPSMPMTELNIAYASFDEYIQSALSGTTRYKVRKKLKAAETGGPIELTVTNDITPIVDELYPLYLQVYERSKLHFELLTKDYFCRLGTQMPDKVRYFVWRRGGKAVAFTECMVHGDTIFSEYIGLDYTVALELHLYHYAYRDVISWAIANGYKRFQSSSLNYDPKLHYRQRLMPVDLYVKHTSGVINAFMRAALPWLAPTRYDKTLKKFPNYSEL